jgi:hypothetical protein
MDWLSAKTSLINIFRMVNDSFGDAFAQPFFTTNQPGRERGWD